MNSALISRRGALRTLLASAAACTLPCTSRSEELAALAVQNAQKLHAEIWRRFISPEGVLLDYTDLQGQYPNPSPEECREGKPNALGWWTATENGSMFNGMYLDGAVQRWQSTRAPEDAAKAERLVRGLLRLASLGPKGFMARNIAPDGRSSYPMGSNDQTGPGLYGLWRFLQAGLGDEPLRREITAKFLEVAETLRASAWRMPCQPGAPSPYRGSFARHSWEDAPRLLFLLKAAHALSGEAEWEKLYHEHAAQAAGEPSRTRLEICAAGMQFHRPGSRESWTGASSAIALRGLWELEQEPAMKAAYAQGLAASLQLAVGGLPLAQQFPLESKAHCVTDWRLLNEWWAPQHSEQEAVEVAEKQSRELGRLSPRRYEELKFVREPAFAAWVVSLCPEAALVQQHRPAILEVLARYDFSQLYYSQFFPLEAAWFRLQAAA